MFFFLFIYLNVHINLQRVFFPLYIPFYSHHIIIFYRILIAVTLNIVIIIIHQ